MFGSRNDFGIKEDFRISNQISFVRIRRIQTSFSVEKKVGLFAFFCCNKNVIFVKLKSVSVGKLVRLTFGSKIE